MNEIQLAVPVFYPMAGALLTYLIGRKSKEGRNYFADFVVITEFLMLLYGAVRLQGTTNILEGVCGMGLSFAMDGFRGIYGVVAAFMWMMTIVFSREYFGHYRNRNRYYLFQLVTLPVELNASSRAIQQLNGLGILSDGEEQSQAKRMLGAAALTYIAAAAVAVVNLLRLILIRNNND